MSTCSLIMHGVLGARAKITTNHKKFFAYSQYLKSGILDYVASKSPKSHSPTKQLILLIFTFDRRDTYLRNGRGAHEEMRGAIVSVPSGETKCLRIFTPRPKAGWRLGKSGQARNYVTTHYLQYATSLNGETPTSSNDSMAK